MFDKFENLKTEKKENIIQAALAIFSEYGYELASTNKIVQEAGISKGTLFYYFQNKKNLYHYLIDYSLEIITTEYIDQVDNTTSDFIERMKNNSKIKFIYFQKYPRVNQFLAVVRWSEFEELASSYREKFEELSVLALNKINEDKESPHNLFKEGIDPEKAMKIIELTIKGYLQETAETFEHSENITDIHLESLWDEFEEYLNLLRKVFYK